MILRQFVEGVSAAAATEVMKKYPTLADLQAALIHQSHATMLDLAETTYKVTPSATADTKIGVAVAKRIREFCDVDKLAVLLGNAKADVDDTADDWVKTFKSRKKIKLGTPRGDPTPSAPARHRKKKPTEEECEDPIVDDDDD